MMYWTLFSTVWKLLKSELNVKCNSTRQSLHTAEELNTHFVKVANQLISNIPPAKTSSSTFVNNLNKSPVNSICFWQTDENEILKSINELKSSTSNDLYGLNSTVIKFVAPTIAKPLSVLINRCIDEGIFPSCLKVAKTIALHKKGDINNINNYRPISILPIISKIFEKILKKT